MTRRRLILSIALAARRSQGRSDVSALPAQTCGIWALQSARHISWPATSDEQDLIKVVLPLRRIAHLQTPLS